MTGTGYIMKDKGFIAGIRGFEPAAHRGASARHPGNTLDAFRCALEIIPGCMLETDVRRTRDGKIIMFHDKTLEVTTSGTGPACVKSLQELLQLDAGYNVSPDRGQSFPFRGRGYRICTLQEVLESFPESRISVDIKDNDCEFARIVCSAIKDMGAIERVIIGSFHNRVLGYVREQFPDMATSFGKIEVIKFYLLHKMGFARLLTIPDDALFIPEFILSDKPEYLGGTVFQGPRLLTRGFIEDAHNSGVPVYAWTINDPDNMKRLIEWGIDGIVTDYPDRLKDVMAEKGIEA